MDFVTNNAGWIITVVSGLVFWFVYIIRQNDKLNNFATRVESFERDLVQIKTGMNKFSFEQDTQGSQIQRLETSHEKNTELLHELKSDIKVIASWVRQQEGETVIRRKEL